MKGRVYDPLAGRFMTADPVTQAPFWSQGLNRYSYVFNNPINNTDPSGFSSSSGGDVGAMVMGWVGGVTGLAAAQGFAAGSAMSAGAIAGGIAGVIGSAALNPATSLLSGTYSQFDGRAGGTQSVAAPSGAPKGAGFGRDAPPGATADNKGSVGPTYQAQGRPANLSLFAPERGALADAADYLPNPVHDLPPAARAAMNRGYFYSGMFILGGGGVGRLAGWALARLGLVALRFGATDLVYGASAGGALRALQQSAGGRLLTDIPKEPNVSWVQHSINALNDQLRAGGMIRFDLTNVKDLAGVLANEGEYAASVTAQELRYLQANWEAFKNNVTFIENGAYRGAPW